MSSDAADDDAPGASEDRVSRVLLHRRQVNCEGYLRSDGDFEIEGRIVDRKTSDASLIDGRRLAAGEPWHEMALRVRVDRDFVIHAIEVDPVHMPTQHCPEVTAAYGQLVGLKIGRGFGTRVRSLLGGSRGCTHMTELLAPIAATAYQTISGHFLSQSGGGGWRSAGILRMARSLIDSCHVWRRDGEVVRLHFADVAADGGDRGANDNSGRDD